MAGKDILLTILPISAAEPFLVLMTFFVAVFMCVFAVFCMLVAVLMFMPVLVFSLGRHRFKRCELRLFGHFTMLSFNRDIHHRF